MSGGLSCGYPRGAFNTHWYNLFNAIAFQIVVGAPIILYSKSLGASSLVLGLIASFTPLMTAFQLPAARHLQRYGYKTFILMGWGWRTAMIFLIAVIPFLFFFGNEGKIVTLIVALFFFNLLRGLASAAWLPWITELISEEIRGRFLSIDQFFIQAGALLALLVSALVMSEGVRSWEYSVVFLISAVGGTISLFFIKRIPDVAAGGGVRHSSHQVPWMAMLAHPPFRELLIFNLLFVAVAGSLSIFTIEYLHEAGMSVSYVLFLSAMTFMGALGALPFIGLCIDGVDGEILMRLALATFGVVIAGWFLIAAGLLSCSPLLVGVLNFLIGAAGAVFNIANMRTLMMTMPKIGRDHFYAFFTVISSVGLGAAPILWGTALDVFGTYKAVTGAFHWHRYSFYFLALLFLDIVAFLYLSKVNRNLLTRSIRMA